jgi:hypothetical protein
MKVFRHRWTGQGSAGELFQNVAHGPPHAGLGEDFFAAFPGGLFPRDKDGGCLGLVGRPGGTADAPAVGPGKTAPPHFGIRSFDEMRHTVTNNVTIHPCKGVSHVV